MSSDRAPSIIGLSGLSFISGLSAGRLWNYSGLLAKINKNNYSSFKDLFNEFLTAPYQCQFFITAFGLLMSATGIQLYRQFSFDRQAIDNKYPRPNALSDKLKYELKNDYAWLSGKMIVSIILGYFIGYIDWPF